MIQANKDMFICYNWMPLVADHVLDFKESFYEQHGVSRLHDCDIFDPMKVKNNDLIFVKTDFIVSGYFNDTILDKLYNRFNIITGISSYQLGRDCDGAIHKILGHPGLNKMFCVHPPDIENDKIIPIPIGFEEKERDGGNPEVLKRCYNSRKSFNQKKDKILLPKHNVSTNPERAKLVNYLKDLPFVETQKEQLPFEDYLNLLNEYKFIIGLEGSGPDIHRNYEALLMNSVPINIRNVIKNIFDYHNIPGVFLNSWEDLNNNSYEKLMKHAWRSVDTENLEKFLTIDYHMKLIKDILANEN